MRNSVWALMLAIGGGLAGASEVEVEKVDLFDAGTDGYAIYRIPGVVVTPKGTVLAYCEARRTGSDWAEIDVLLRRSEDGGRTWDPPIRVAHRGPDVPPNPSAPKSRPVVGKTTNNPVAVVDRRSGTVHLLYCVEYARCFAVRSEDDGRTFSDPIDVTAAFEPFRDDYDWRVIAVGPGHGVQLESGRLVVPVWLSLGQGGNGHSPSVAGTIVSDDAGATWRRGAIAAPATEAHHSPNESVVVELADGRVMLNSRNSSPSHRRLATTSPDGARGWTEPAFVADLPEPACMAGLIRLPESLGAGPDRLVFSQPGRLAIPPGSTPPKGWKDRRNLTLRVSLDSGATWPLARTLEPGPSAYSDLAALSDGTVLCFYERSREEGEDAKGSPYGRLTLARIPAGWLPSQAP